MGILGFGGGDENTLGGGQRRCKQSRPRGQVFLSEAENGRIWGFFTQNESFLREAVLPTKTPACAPKMRRREKKKGGKIVGEKKICYFAIILLFVGFFFLVFQSRHLRGAAGSAGEERGN